MAHDPQLDEVKPRRPALSQTLKAKLNDLTHSPFGTLLRLFLGRISHGSGDADDGQLDLGPGVTALLLAMPGMLISLLMLEKYGSLIHFLHGDVFTFDAFA